MNKVNNHNSDGTFIEESFKIYNQINSSLNDNVLFKKHLILSLLQSSYAGSSFKRLFHLIQSSFGTLNDQNKTKQLDQNAILLEKFRNYEENWNGYGAPKFADSLINDVESILLGIRRTPKIFPTGRHSIQFEYEKQNGDYLEFEIYSMNKVGLLMMIGDNPEQELMINANQINGYLAVFYAE